MEEHELISFGMSIVQRASARGIDLRLLGSIAVAVRCPRFRTLWGGIRRRVNDIDLAGYLKHRSAILDLLADIGFSQPTTIALVCPRDRLSLRHTENGVHLDAYLDRINYCHSIPWSRRLLADYPTVPLAELLLTKAQIVELNERDVIDMLILLREHPVGAVDGDRINIHPIALLCSRDWGLWQTVTINFRRVVETGLRFSWLTAGDMAVIRGRIRQITHAMDSEPKTLLWRIRSKVGDRMKRYHDVFEYEER